MTTPRFSAAAFVATHAATGGEIAAIAVQLGITRGYANAVRLRLGLPSPVRPTAKARSSAGVYVKPAAVKSLRACMKCKRSFKSEGAHNRLCCRCKEPDSAQMMEGW